MAETQDRITATAPGISILGLGLRWHERLRGVARGSPLIAMLVWAVTEIREQARDDVPVNLFGTAIADAGPCLDSDPPGTSTSNQLYGNRR